jgi:Abnormal spindle-like microcephaly-assoc'd, ASPM-SPD-2-Hydin
MSPPPRFRTVAARRSSRSHDACLAYAIFFSIVLSGCASVSSEKSSPEPAATKISVLPSAIDFNSVVIGQKNSQTVKITNISGESFDLRRLHVSGSGFTLSNAKAPLLLAPGRNTNFSVVFAPGSSAAVTGSLIVASPDLESPVTIPLSGSGEKPEPKLQVSPASISFGSRPVNSSAFQSVTLTNTGNVALKVSSVTHAHSGFSVTGISAGVSLSPDQRLEFQVWFRPSAAGKASATITVESASLSAPVKLAVSGSGTTSSVTSPDPSPAHSVTLGWAASSSAVAGYHIYRGGSSGGPYNRISGSIISSLTYKDENVQSGEHYHYVVTAVGADGSESAYSNEVTVEIPST